MSAQAAENAQLKQELAAARQAKASLEQSLTDSRASCGVLQAQLTDQLNSQIHEARSAILDAMEIEHWRRRSTEADKRIDALQQETDKLRLQRQEMSEEIRQTKNWVDQLTLDHDDTRFQLQLTQEMLLAELSLKRQVRDLYDDPDENARVFANYKNDISPLSDEHSYQDLLSSLRREERETPYLMVRRRYRSTDRYDIMMRVLAMSNVMSSLPIPPTGIMSVESLADADNALPEPRPRTESLSPPETGNVIHLDDDDEQPPTIASATSAMSDEISLPSAADWLASLGEQDQFSDID